MELGQPEGPPRDLAVARQRLVWFAIVALGWAGILFARLVDFQVVRRSFFEEKARLQQKRTVAVAASRGLILDRRGRTLAISVPVDSIFATLSEISDRESVQEILSPILGIPRAELARKLAPKGGFVWIQRLVDPEVSERVKALNLRGIYFQKESKRYYPKGTTAAHLIGAVGLDQAGLAGIEQSRDEDLQGLPGRMVVSSDARQRHFAGLLTQEPEPGLNLMLTIDERIQSLVERELEATMLRTGAEAASIVITEPSSGAVLAMASAPSFNPNQPVRSAVEAERRRNFAVGASFEPGSTFKLITVAAALEEKLTRPDEVIDCQMGSIVVGGRRIKDHKPFGRLTVSQVVANSSDVGVIKLGMRLGDRRMYQYIRRFGFGRATGVELPGEEMGLTKPDREWSGMTIGAISMGQEVGVTAMQMVQAVGVIANDGVLQPPRVIETLFENGRQPATAPPRPGRRVISAETAIQVKRMMEMALLEGTGKQARLQGYTAGGKTGTAQKIDPVTRAYSKTKYVAGFVGIAPLRNPSIAVAVVVDSPKGLHSGGGVAAPIFGRIAGEVLRYLGVPEEMPDDPARRRRARLDERPWNREPAAATVRVAQNYMPDFLGQPVRTVAEMAAAIGLAVDMRGSGVARQQVPLPGTPLGAEPRVLVEFEQ